MLRRERAAVLYGDDLPDLADEETPPVSDAMAAGQRDALVRDAMADLSPEQREVVRRAFFEEQPHSAIAEALDLPLGTVKSRLRLAFKKLRDRLENLRI
jgi:RNA polymerase sigma-70 factor (ECF subfamily)